LFARIAEPVRQRSLELVNGQLSIDCVLFDPDGGVLGTAG
jgi:hypothetical protein